MQLESPHCQGRELAESDIPRLQAFFEANPQYFQTVKGRSPGPNEARDEFDDIPPAHLGFSRRWFAGLFDLDREMVGVVAVVADLAARGVWHIALFVIASHLHRRRLGSEVFAALETWARKSGANWLRLGAVDDNLPALSFWSKHGFCEVRRRADIDTGGRLANVVVMIKPLGELGIEDYLVLVPRDRSGSTLA